MSSQTLLLGRNCENAAKMPLCLCPVKSYSYGTLRWSNLPKQSEFCNYVAKKNNFRGAYETNFFLL